MDFVIHLFCCCVVCYNKNKEDKFEQVSDPCSWIKDTFAKKGCFREEFKKKTSEAAFYAEV
jgi:uncharacterized membrane protein